MNKCVFYSNDITKQSIWICDGFVYISYDETSYNYMEITHHALRMMSADKRIDMVSMISDEIKTHGVKA